MAFTSWYQVQKPEGEHLGTRLYQGYSGIENELERRKEKEEEEKKKKEEEEKKRKEEGGYVSEADRQLDAVRDDVAAKEHLKSELDDAWLYEPEEEVKVKPEEEVKVKPGEEVKVKPGEEAYLLEQYKRIYPNASFEELANIITQQQAYSANRGFQ